MKVTVVIPNYNGIEYLKECLKSLEQQSFKDFTIMIVDNCSQDGSPEFI
ncbi:MAG: glycosyltransferase, partial [Lachnospiraceae bacterium]|nr:glycosyltransferase [Lachnospiraceae bacterium]